MNKNYFLKHIATNRRFTYYLSQLGSTEHTERLTLSGKGSLTDARMASQRFATE